ncbi:hypothetical protein M408DRAFT_329466, partial [Serendipita vermifera MAFF 305830]
MVTYPALPFDVIHHICSTVYHMNHKAFCSLSLVDQRIRTACIPFLFEEIIFDRQWGEDGIPWDGVPDAIEDILKQRAILNAVRSLHFQPWVHKFEESPIPTAFFKLLFSLPNLRHLAILLQSPYQDQFRRELGLIDEDTIQSGKKLLPTVQSVRIASAAWMFISDCSPNLVALDVTNASTTNWPPHQDPDLDIAKLGKIHPELEELYCDLPGTEPNVREIADHLPRIQGLGLWGRGYREPNGILDHLHAFTRLKNLKSLSVPGASGLGMGFYPPRCGNAYRQDPGLRDKAAKQGRDTMEKFMRGIETRIISEKGSTLREVVVGSISWGGQEIWEKGEDGKLRRNKAIERSGRTRKVIKVTKL